MRKRTLVVVIVIFIFVGAWFLFSWLGKISYNYAYDNGWNANQKLNDQQILNILVRHNLGKSWNSALGSLREADLLCQAIDGKIYVSAYENNVLYSTKSCGGDTIQAEGTFIESFTPSISDVKGNPVVLDMRPRVPVDKSKFNPQEVYLLWSWFPEEGFSFDLDPTEKFYTPSGGTIQKIWTDSLTDEEKRAGRLLISDWEYNIWYPSNLNEWRFQGSKILNK